MPHARTLAKLVPLLTLLAGAPAFAADHRQAIRERLVTLQNLTAYFSTEASYTPPPDADPPRPANVGPLGPLRLGPAKKGVECYGETFRFFGGMVVADATLVSDTTPQPENVIPLIRSAWSISPGRYEHLSAYTPDQPVVGAIKSDPDPVPFLWTIDTALGLRAWDAQTYLTSADLDKADIQDRAPDEVTLSRRSENGCRHTWLFDLSRDYALKRYEVASRNGAYIDTTECTDFERIGGAMLPRAVVRRISYGGKPPGVTITLHVQRYVLPDRKNDRVHMRIEWPKGALVADLRSGKPRQMIADDQGLLIDRASVKP